VTISAPGDYPITYRYAKAENEHLGSMLTEAQLEEEKKELVVADIRVVAEFEDVFQEVPGLPPHREIEF